MKKMIELISVSAGYRDSIILQDVNLTVYEKDFLGIIGPNGGGKTTLLRVLLGLIRPYHGRIVVHDPELRDRHIGYLPQFKSADRDFPITVRDVAHSGLMGGMKRRTGKDDMARVDSILEQFGLYGYRDRPLGELSGGQMQRVYLCRALISSPRLLILDEPDTFVDSGFSGNLNDILRDLNKNIAIVLVSHDLGAVLPTVKNIACVNQSLHYHSSREFSRSFLEENSCPVRIVGHGDVPHTVLKKHGDHQ